MKKLFLLVLMILGLFGVALAADNARNIGSNKNIDHAVIVADLSNGYTQKVNANGTAVAAEDLKTIAFVNSQSGGAELVLTGGATVYGIVVTGTTNSDWVAVYDATSATGTPVLDVVTSANNPTATIPIPGGRKFSNGIFVDLGTSTTHAEIMYIPD
ncbi:MAG: hypothetical protein HY761_09980 [Candidatus Omnitrophica bacterium]|nr:hypothetical protein [Candidatus Omnitrophota bacterium]